MATGLLELGRLARRYLAEEISEKEFNQGLIDLMNEHQLQVEVAESLATMPGAEEE